MKKINIEEFDSWYENFCSISLHTDYSRYVKTHIESKKTEDLDVLDEEFKKITNGIEHNELSKPDNEIVLNFLNLIFEELFYFSHKNNIFFNHCSYSVFESTFKDRFLKYQETFVDAIEVDFLKYEFENLRLEKGLYDDILNRKNKKISNDSYNKKYEFLESKFLKENIIVSITENLPMPDEWSSWEFNYDECDSQNPESLDLSNTSAVEKIIYLNELGIIDFLRTKPEFTLSTNLLATVLSAITDVKTTTLQSSLNRLISNDTADKTHPYRTQKTVEKVRQNLINKNIKLKTS